MELPTRPVPIQPKPPMPMTTHEIQLPHAPGPTGPVFFRPIHPAPVTSVSERLQLPGVEPHAMPRALDTFQRNYELAIENHQKANEFHRLAIESHNDAQLPLQPTDDPQHALGKYRESILYHGDSLRHQELALKNFQEVLNAHRDAAIAPHPEMITEEWHSQPKRSRLDAASAGSEPESNMEEMRLAIENREPAEFKASVARASDLRRLLTDNSSVLNDVINGRNNFTIREAVIDKLFQTTGRSAQTSMRNIADDPELGRLLFEKCDTAAEASAIRAGASVETLEHIIRARQKFTERPLETIISHDDGSRMKTTLLSNAVQHGTPEMIAALLDWGADPTIGTSFRNTPLHDVCRLVTHGRNPQSERAALERFKALLEHPTTKSLGSDYVNLKNQLGNTALHVAYANKKITPLFRNALIDDYKADQTIKNNRGLTPVEVNPSRIRVKSAKTTATALTASASSTANV